MTLPEMIFLVAVTVILPISVLSLLFSYQKARLRSKRAPSESELTTSELRGMIEETVSDATAELQQRVESLEHQFRLLAPPTGDQSAEEPVVSKTLGGIERG